jgi:hypothetical protein
MVAAGDDNGFISFYEVASGAEVRRFAGGMSIACSLTFAPDGRTLLAGNSDGTILIWDVTGGVKPRSYGRDALDHLWQNLGGDGPTAQQALWGLTAAPAQAVSLVKEKVRRVPPAASRLARLIADLDDEDFAVREAATVKLERLGHGAEAALRAVLAKRSPPEVSKRIRRLLAGLSNSTLSSRGLQLLRAVELLECLGTPGARAVLADLAKGEPASWLTQEAKASLRRVARRRVAAR